MTFMSEELIINEIEKNKDEFVEFFNLSEKDTVTLSGWRLGDGAGDDSIADAGEGCLILPNQYAVILDADYFGNSTSYDAQIPEEALIMTVGGMTLGSGGLSNSKSETITLMNRQVQLVCHYTYTIGNEPGYSDEKMDLKGSDQSSNWFDSKTLMGTPGEKNSVYPNDLHYKLDISVHPNPFSPDGDGFEDEALIYYLLPFDRADVSIRIFDIRGRLIRTLLSGVVSGKEGRMIWDGKDDSGQKSRMGTYIIVLESLNSILGQAVSKRTTLILASPL
jgi:hypothetical protein